MLVSSSHPESRSLHRGFTIVELLIVVAVVILLLSILIVAMNYAVKGAQVANTSSLMNSISQALITFHKDHGYYPPVLNDNRGVKFTFGSYDSFSGPNPADGAYDDHVQNWYSITTLAEYLIGYDSGRYDGYGDIDYDPDNNSNYDGELPRTGIRSPGPDGVWNATLMGAQDGSLAARVPHPQTSSIIKPGGRRFGPYLELKDERLLGAINPAGDIVFPGEVPDSVFDTYHKVICDYWGNPIRYYRPAYPAGNINAKYTNIPPRTTSYGHEVPVPSLSDVFVLRPFSIDVGSHINGLPDHSAEADPTSVRALLAAEFATFSRGPDGVVTEGQRVDQEEFNRDNIVQVGP